WDSRASRSGEMPFMETQLVSTSGRTETLLRDRDVAVRLNVSRASVWRLVKSGRLPSVRIGVGSTRFRPEDVDALINPSSKEGPAEQPGLPKSADHGDGCASG